jgi:hypothetical protein
MTRTGISRWRRNLMTSLVALSPSLALAGTPLVMDAQSNIPMERQADPLVSRSRGVTVNLKALRSEANRSLELELFNGTRLELVREQQEPMPGGFVWQGRIAGQERSVVMLSVVDDVVSGNIATESGEIYQLRYVGNGLHAMRQIDPSKYPDEAEPLQAEPVKEPQGADVQPMADTGAYIDVMVAYTAAARSAQGGASAMASLINLAVSETNTAYANSGINQRIRLVHSVEVSYTETGDMGTDLSRLRATADGYMDNVHTLRNTYKADLVSLFVANGGSACGIAYVMSSVSTGFAPNGFSVVDKDCATGNYSFGHELGHNMGARHDRYVDNTDNSPYTYNHGYYYTPGKWRTVMAYNNGCSAAGVSCTRINYWSNPNKFYNGVAMGVSSTSTSAADNRLTLNNTAYTVANFRASQ